jgi:hypothetical protein
MRKSFLLGVISVIVASSVTAVNAAAPRTGAPCAKLGLKQVFQGKTFTCVNSGKKLVWGKGKTILAAPKATPSAKPSQVSEPKAEPSPSPTSSPSPSTTTASVPKAPTSFDDLVENYRGISYAAWSKSREKILASKPTNINLKILLGPTSQLTYKEPMVAINLISRLYSGYVKEIDLHYLAFNFDDRDWAVKQMDSIIDNTDSRWIKFTACKTTDTCWGGGSFYDGKSNYLAVVALGVFDSNHTTGTLEAHEFAHVVQQMNYKASRPPVEFVMDPWPPDWYWEGQAQFAQHAAIYYDSYSTYMSERAASSEQLFRFSKFNSEHIEKFFVFNAPDEWRNTYEKWRLYDLGAMFVEILTALQGPAATMEVWKIASTGVNFDVAFERVYGISFAKAVPIMARAIALQLGHEK